MKLAGKIAAITGSTAGMGRGIAEAFLAERASVALFARNADKGAKVLEEIGAGDVMNQSDLEGFIDHTIQHLGTIDILVNNAGGAGDLQPLVNLSDHAFDEAMKWNVYSTFWVTRRAPDHARKAGREDHQHLQHGGQARKADADRLLSRQAHGERHDQEPRALSGRSGGDGQRDLPRPRHHRYHQEQRPRHRQGDGYGAGRNDRAFRQLGRNYLPITCTRKA